MADPEAIAKAAEISGSTVAVSCGVCRWLVVNHDLLAVLGILIGAIVAVAGLGVSWYYQHQRLKYEVRQKPRRQQK